METKQWIGMSKNINLGNYNFYSYVHKGNFKKKLFECIFLLEIQLTFQLEKA